MDKNAIKKFAIWARKELIARVTQRAYLYGVMVSRNSMRSRRRSMAVCSRQ